MTVTQLIEKLAQIQKTNPRAPVVVDWESVCSDDYSHGLVNSVDTDCINWTDGDGCTVINKDGSEHQKQVVVLSGR